jgi:hypothetical protein
MLRNSRAPIFCEDNLSKLILSDIFGSENVDLVPLSGWQHVQAAVKGEPLWETVRSKGMKCCGVIDRDTRDEETVSELAARNIFCFPVYDAESLLLDRDVALWMLRTSSGSAVTSDQFEDILAEAALKAHDLTLKLLAKYIAERAKPEIVPTLMPDQTTLRSVVVNTDTATLEAKFRIRAGEMAAALATKDAAAIPKLFKGKKLYPLFADGSRQIVPGGLTRDAATKYNEIRNHPEFKALIARLPWLQAFKQQVLRAVI